MANRPILADKEVRILCVDDERNVLKALRRIFIDDDWEILTAQSADEGLDILAREEVQLVVSDYRMPGMNGVDFLGKVRQRWPDTIRIVLSGYADAASIVAAINEGEIYKFIPKPWNDDELKVTLETALEHYFLQMENRKLLARLQKSNEKLQQMNDSLEQLVEERTEELRFQNRALKISQTVLDALPIGVVGLDVEGTVVRTNAAAMDLLGMEKEFIIGLPREDVLPAGINQLIEAMGEQRCLHGDVQVNKQELRYWLSRLKTHDQEGLVLGLADLSGHCPCPGEEDGELGERLCLMSRN